MTRDESRRQVGEMRCFLGFVVRAGGDMGQLAHSLAPVWWSLKIKKVARQDFLG